MHMVQVVVSFLKEHQRFFYIFICLILQFKQQLMQKYEILKKNNTVNPQGVILIVVGSQH